MMLLPEGAPLELDPPSFWSRVHAEDMPGLMSTSSAVAEGKLERAEEVFRIRRMDGCWAWMLSRCVVTENSGGKAIRVIGKIVDVSRLRLNAKFQIPHNGEALTNYQAMLENSPDMIARMDRELFPLYVNPAINRYLPRPLSKYSMGAETVASLGLEPSHLEFVQNCVQEVFHTGRVVRRQTAFKTAAVGKVAGEYSFWPEFNSGGKVVSVISHFRDHTEQIRAEQRARLNETRMAALYRLTQMANAPEEELLHYVTDSITEFTGSGYGYVFIPPNIQYPGGRMVWSKAHHSFFGNGGPPPDSPSEELVAYRVCAQDGHSPLSINNGDGINPTHLAHDGRLPIMRYMNATVLEGQRPVCIAVVCNKDADYEDADLRQLELFINGAWLILRRHHYIKALQTAKDVAERANKIKDEFLANVSHELRTPLNGILSMLQLLDLSSLSSAQREYVRTAELSGETLMRILSDILDFSRIESGKMVLHPLPFDLKNTLRSTLDLFTGEVCKKMLTLTLNVDDEIPSLLVGDDARVRQIIFNVVGNAIKFTEQGEIHVECSLLNNNHRQKAWVYFAVKDTGIGIPEHLQSSIFEAFTQIDNSSTRKYAGTGLGLGIVKRLVDMMGGNITVESLKNLGTTFHFSIPFETVARNTPKCTEAWGTAGTFPRKALDILVAEDDAASRFALNAFLRRNGHRAVCVSNGRQALEAAMLHPFDCIFTDIQMPEMDGLEMTRRIREQRLEDIIPSDEVREIILKTIPEAELRRRDLPADAIVTAVSAHAMYGDRERFLRQGMDLYLSKPVILDDLAHILDQISARLY